MSGNEWPQHNVTPAVQQGGPSPYKQQAAEAVLNQVAHAVGKYQDELPMYGPGVGMLPDMWLALAVAKLGRELHVPFSSQDQYRKNFIEAAAVLVAAAAGGMQ